MLSDEHSVTGLEYWYLGEKASKAIAAHEIDNDVLSTTRSLVSDIASIAQNGVYPARDTEVINNYGKITSRSTCTYCEFESTCYSEYKQLFDPLMQENDHVRYATATGALLTAEQGQCHQRRLHLLTPLR